MVKNIQKQKMKKVFIIGIDSFTGVHLSSYLEECGYEIFGSSYNKNNYSCDISNKKQIKKIFKKIKPDFIIHLAGISMTNLQNRENYYNINTLGAINILDSLIELNQTPKKIILASSAIVYGNQTKRKLKEDFCPQPINHYGVSKYAMEIMAKNYFDKLNIIISRPFNYSGVGQKDNFLITKIVKHYKENKKVIELGNLKIKREFNDILFVCEVYKRLLETKQKSEIVNICSNRAIKLLDIIDIMDKIAGYKMKIEVNPKFVRKNEIRKLTGCPDKLYSMVGKIKQKKFKKTLKDIYEA